MTRLRVLSPGGHIVDVDVESARTCDGCTYWRPRQCALLGCALPVWAGPLRPRECYQAATAVEEVDRAATR